MMSLFSSLFPESRSCWDSSVFQNSEKAEGVTRISFLNPAYNGMNWMIKAKVVSKSDIKTSEFSSDVKQFSVVNLSDKSGVIRATLYDSACDRFYDLLQLNKTYYIRNGFIKPANKDHTTIEHNFNLNFGFDTIVKPCPENENDVIANIPFNFTPIEDIEKIEVGRFIDVIGIIDSVEEVESPGDKILQKIELLSADHEAISVCLWGINAGKFDAFDSPGSVLAIKSAKVAQFQYNKVIHVSEMQSIMIVDPDIQETHQLQKLYRDEYESLNW